MKNIKYLMLMGLFLVQNYLFSQNNNDYKTRKYYTQIMNNSVAIDNADFLSMERNLNRNLFENNRFVRSDKITVPIVFHVLYARGQNYPSIEQIIWQLETLNSDFAGTEYKIDHPADTLERFSSKQSDVEISFCVAAINGNGNNRNTGISFTETNVKEWGANWDMGFKNRGGADAYKTDKYLNIWVVDLADSVSGWATYPWLGEFVKVKNSKELFDGIVIGFDFFGQSAEYGGTALAPYDNGKTLTHLIGNYLGLLDLWNEYALCADDYIDDTPIHNAPNYGCQIYKHVSTCHKQPVEMIMNFMDNSDDECLRMFTNGQKMRMQGMLSKHGLRDKLITSPSDCQLLYPEDVVESRDTDINNYTAKESITLNLYPNPANNEINFELENVKSQDLIEIAVYSIQGQRQYFLTDVGDIDNYYLGQIDVKLWLSGIYYLVITTSSEVVTTKFTIQN
jgi:hypothetical protein